MAVVGNCVNLLGLPARFQDFFIGFVIILVVLVDHLTQKRGKVTKPLAVHSHSVAKEGGP
jgi:ribose/xylose/arabinose/galactoside ABC-type transport system permease subunit